jgi:hypothetical protein
MREQTNRQGDKETRGQGDKEKERADLSPCLLVPLSPCPNTEAVEFSNSIRLTGRQWLCVGLFAVLLVVFAPRLWKSVEPFPLEADYRMPHDLSNDYWLYERYAELAAGHYDTVLIGDSVIWGEYVTRQETLSHYLNALSGQERYANLGLDGAHPLALTGLVEHYAGSVKGKNVVLQCNPLWLSSPKADLQDDTATEFNHPRLVPQFLLHLPAYKEEYSPRLGVVVEQHTTFGAWTNHLQQAYYDRSDIPSWTLEHPYANPVKPLTRGLPPSDNSLRHLPQPWYKSGITKQEYPWVDLNTSLQWQAFQRVVQILQRRGNRVFVLVGPFNEHLLNPEIKPVTLWITGSVATPVNEHLLNPKSYQQYQQVMVTIAAWLEAQQIPHSVPPPLPSELYGDASHPLAAGYEMLARQLLEESAFQAAQGSAGK